MKNLQSRTKVRLLQSFLLISLSLFFFVNPAYAQGGFAVKGVIVDKTGFPLPGATKVSHLNILHPIELFVLSSLKIQMTYFNHFTEGSEEVL